MNQIIPEIVTQHAEEAAFLWLLRDGAVRVPHYQLPDLAKLDGRVEAHLDGLRVNGDPGWEICTGNGRRRSGRSLRRRSAGFRERRDGTDPAGRRGGDRRAEASAWADFGARMAPLRAGFKHIRALLDAKEPARDVSGSPPRRSIGGIRARRSWLHSLPMIRRSGPGRFGGGGAGVCRLSYHAAVKPQVQGPERPLLGGLVQCLAQRP